MSKTSPGPATVERRLLNYQLAAAYLGIGVTKMKKLAAAGLIPKVALEGRILFDRADLDAYIEKLKREA